MDAPWYALALVLLVIPPLLRLFFPPRPSRLPFSQMFLLNKVVGERRLVKRKNPWWLNLVRMLCLGALIFCWMGWRWPSTKVDPRSALVILFDDTLYGHQENAEGQSLWELQNDEIQRALDNATPHQRIAFIGRSGQRVEWSDLSSALSYLKRQRPGYRQEDWASVLQHLTRLYRHRERENVQVAFFGPLKTEDLEGFQRLLSLSPEDIKWSDFTQPFEALPNRSLHLVSHRREQQMLLMGRVYGERSGQLDITSSGSPAQSLPHESKIHLLISEHNATKVSLAGNDGFPLDDHYFFEGAQTQHLRVLLLQHPEAPQRLQDSGYYLEQGLRSASQTIGVHFQTLTPRDWQRAKYGAGDLVIFHHPPALSKEERNALSKGIKAGAKCIFLVGPHTPQNLLEDFAFAPAQLKQGPSGDLAVQWTPAWRSIAPEITATPLQGGWRFHHLHPNSDTSLRYDDGSPFSIQLSTPSGGTVTLMSSPFHILWSRYMLKVDFPSFCRHLLETNLPPPTLLHDLSPGDSWPEEISSIAQQMGSTGPSVTPGIYNIQTREGVTSTIGVNFNPSLYGTRLATELTVESSSQRGSLSSNALGARLDKELAFFFILFLILESWVLYRQMPHLLRH